MSACDVKMNLAPELSPGGEFEQYSNILESAREEGRKVGLSAHEADVLATKAFMHVCALKGAAKRGGETAFRQAVGQDAFAYVQRQFKEDFTPDNVAQYPVGVLVLLKTMLAANHMSSMFGMASIEGPQYRINSQDGKLSEQIDFGSGDVDVYPEQLGRVLEMAGDPLAEVAGDPWFGADEYDVLPANAFDPSLGVELELSTETGEVNWYALSFRHDLKAERLAEALYLTGVVNETAEFAANLSALFAFSRALSTAITVAGIRKTWSRTMPAGSVYELLDPRAWNMTLFDLVGSMPMEAQRWKDAPEPLSWVACSPTTMRDVYKMAPQSRGGFFSFSNGDSVQRGTSRFGVTNQRGGTATPEMEITSYSTTIMPDDKLLFGPAPVADANRSALLHVEFMALSQVGELVDPVTRERKRGWMSANKDVPLRVNNLALIELTD